MYRNTPPLRLPEPYLDDQAWIESFDFPKGLISFSLPVRSRVQLAFKSEFLFLALDSKTEVFVSDVLVIAFNG